MSTSGQKSRNIGVKDDNTSSSSSAGERVLSRASRSVVSSDSEVAERIPQCTALAVVTRASEERVTHEVFKC